jgi:ferredoxin
MALTITDDCIVCGACDYVCPTDAIVPSTVCYTIRADRCTECVGHFDRPQCVAACPVDCIVPAPRSEPCSS